MISRALWLLCLAALGSRAQDSSSTITPSDASRTSTGTSSSSSGTAFDYDGLSFTNSYSIITGSYATSDFTGSNYVYESPTGQSTVRTLTETFTASNGSLATVTTTSTNTQITLHASSVSVTEIGALPNNATTTAGNSTMTASSTTSSAQPTNTVPCNGFPEFCNRKYSNITMIAAHNADFSVKGNIASNQEFGIVTQLDDGIRMLTGETHYVNDTMYNCHTSCSLLNTGTLESELVIVREWLQAHPYDVVTVLLVNSDFVNVNNYTAPITNAGLLPYAYTPEYIPQHRDQWPTLGDMILRNQRVVFFIDYNANQAEVPYVLDQYTHMWETPFSPTDQAFPCTIQRPPNLNHTVAKEQWMYLANHNLNTPVDLSSIGITTSTQLLVPNTAELNLTNGQGLEFGALGRMTENCTSAWDLPPNFLVVDYYNFGSNDQGQSEPGSVFHVAAAANGVVYTQQCCGPTSSAPVQRASSVGLVIALVATVLFAW